MDKNFGKCLALLLVSEGGNDDNPHDLGGRTSRGITQREYDAYRRRENLPDGDVWKATDAEVRQIYHDSYWLPWCDRMPRGLDYLFFDMSVLMGPSRATKTLQRALEVPPDGHFGIITATQLARAPLTRLIHEVSSERAEFYRGLPAYRYFGKGWMNRTFQVEKDALAMIPDHAK